ncbi:unnamed protein product [Adineta steineri]|uniref:G-protein coupled receptors family 1 profile domain-containing protein n=1 Tax=Adineta steineri TaxID=433720 RepID=A0A816A2F5_9BILA|nr:unnamed protein product [Adineta steineri]CAF1163858.1 unnamed protein product [Adineta steineri]CAF1337674.1 unnamed protein product [Adineta steineri]CAF1591826.1 unnamed protein product [Adineta steineri]
MSSQSNSTIPLVLVQKQLYRFGGPILMIFGTVSSILSLIIFLQKNLRKNPCSIYLIAFNIGNLFLIYTSLFSLILINGYNMNSSLYNLIICRLHFYTMLIFGVLSPSYLILASIDRILVTSRYAIMRSKSTHRLAYICIMIVTLLWLLFHSHALVLTNIIEPLPNFFRCYFQPGIYLVFIGYYSLIIKGIFIPLLMIIFGLWTVKNIRSIGRIDPRPVLIITRRKTIGGLYLKHSKDRQFIQILFIDIIVYIIFSLMISAVFMYQQFAQYKSYNLISVQILGFLTSIATFSSYIPFCFGFYTNFIMSKQFRHEVKHYILCQ